MRTILIFFLLLISPLVFAQQKQGANWMFGNGHLIEFSGQNPILHEIWNGALKGAATISDEKGNLIFSNQDQIPYTRNYTLIGNPPTVRKYPYVPAYFHYKPGSQYFHYPGFAMSAYAVDMIVPDPADPQVYNTFFISEFWGSGIIDSIILYQSKFDLRLNSGWGDIVPNSVQQIKKNVAPKMAAMLHSNNRDTWILVHDRAGANFYAYLLTPAGLSAPVITPSGRPLLEKGRMKSSPNSQTFVTNSAAGVELFDFNRSTGVPAFRQTLAIPFLGASTNAYSNAFSPDGSKLYVGTGKDTALQTQTLPFIKAHLYQFNLGAGNPVAVQNSRTRLFTFDTTAYVSDIQLAIDGKLYIINGLEFYHTEPYLSRINCPDQPGTACRFRQNEIDLQGRRAGTNLPSLNQTLFRNAGKLQAQAVQDTICPGQSVQLSAYGAGAERFRWQPANGITAPSDTLSNPTVSPTVTTTYMVIGTSPCKADTAFVTITVVPRPAVLALSGSRSVCPQVQGVWYKAQNPQRQQITWGVKGGSLATTTNDSISVNWGNAGTGLVWALPKNRQGCPGDTAFFPVTINVILATQEPAGPDTLCAAAANNIAYRTQATTGSVFTWGISGGNIVSGQGTAAVRVNWNQAGAGNLWVQESSQTSTSLCHGVSDTLRVLIHPSPVQKTVSGPQQVCAYSGGHTYTLNGIGIGATVTWQVQGGQITSGQGTGTITVSWQNGGNGNVTAREVNNLGCPGPVASFPVQIEALPQPQVTATTDLALCPSGLARPHAYAVQSVTGAAYQWFVKGGSITGGKNSNTVQVQWSALNGSTKIGVVQTSALGCQSDTVWLPLRPDATELQLQAISVTENESRLQLTYSTGPSANYPQTVLGLQQNLNGIFQPAGVSPVGGTVSTVSNLKPTASAILRLAGRNLCGDSLYSGSHQSIFLSGSAAGEQINLRWNGYEGWSGGPATYQLWRQADGRAYELAETLGPQARTFTKMVAAAGFTQCYKIKAVSVTGAESWSNSVCASFENLPEFFNIITPNGDGLNDAFVIGKLHLYPQHELQLFNRWGTEVYRSSNYQNNWKAEDLSGGVYYYYFRAKGKSWKGWVEVVK